MTFVLFVDTPVSQKVCYGEVKYGGVERSWNLEKGGSEIELELSECIK